MAFDKHAYLEAVAPHLVVDPEHALDNIRIVRQLSLAADTAIRTYEQFYIPSAEVSAALLEQTAKVSEAIAWLATKITLNDAGCWDLYLAAEYDSKGRARYPQVSKKMFGAHSELAHRFVIRRLYGAEPEREDHWDHVDRRHACCNPTHGELVRARTNNARMKLAAHHTDGMETLFEI